MATTTTTTTAREYDVGELLDLLAAKDADTSADYSAFQGLQERWAVSDPTAEGQWQSDWNTMISAYNAAKREAQLFVDAAKAGTDVFTLGLGSYTDMNATEEYNHVLTALNASALSSTVAPGSFDDLDARLRAAASSLTVVIPPTVTPQPTPSYDSGLSPSSWAAYTTGLGVKLGLVDPADVPPGTPGTGPAAPPLIPTWLKWTLGAAAGTFVVSKFVDVVEIAKDAVKSLR